MGVRSPVVIVKNKRDLNRLKKYCESTKDQGDFECAITGVKVIHNRYYVCISTYTVGLENLLNEFPDLTITNTNVITNGTSFFSYADSVAPIPEWDSIPYTEI